MTVVALHLEIPAPGGDGPPTEISVSGVVVRNADQDRAEIIWQVRAIMRRS